MPLGKIRLFTALTLILLFIGACTTPATTPEPIYLRIAGSTSMLPALNGLAEAYMARHPAVTIDIQGSGSQAGLQSLREGRIDLAAASWKEPAEETNSAETNQDETDRLVWHRIARDGLAIIVHPNNTLRNLSLDGARNMFAGWYIDWNEVNGKGGETQVVSREDGSGSRAAFESSLMEHRSVTQTAIVMPSSQTVVDWVSSHPDAVGYVSMAYITTTIQTVRLNDVELVPQSVEDGSYPLVRYLYLVAREPTSRAAGEFVDFCHSPAGQAIVNSYHAVTD